MFDPRTDLLPEAAGWGQQIRSRVKQNCCCPRSQSITVLLYTFIFSKFSYSLFPLTYPLYVFQYPLLSSLKIWTTPQHCDINIMWLIESMKIRPSVNSLIAGNRSMNCWPVSRTVLQQIGIFFVNSENVVYLLYWFYIGDKVMVYNNICYNQYVSYHTRGYQKVRRLMRWNRYL